MTFFLKNGNSFRVASKDSLDMYEKLPAGVYSVMENLLGYYLEKMNTFTIPAKTYGNTNKHTERIYTTFKDRIGSTGVLLSGQKGSGKTLLSKSLAKRAAEDDLPTLLINSPFHGEGFNLLIQNIEQPCVIIFDEFEKIYPEESHQNYILSLLDGVFNSKKMFVFTVNDLFKVNRYMLNRPGRLFYNLKFEGLSPEFVKEYCLENLNNKDRINDVVAVCEIVYDFNFDMLQCLVEEMNRYNESAASSLQYLNISVSTDSHLYDIIEFTSGLYNEFTMISKELSLNITNPKLVFNFDIKVKVVYTEKELEELKQDNNLPLVPLEDDDFEYINIQFTNKNLLSFNREKGYYTFKNGDGDCITLKKKPATRFNAFNMIFDW